MAVATNSDILKKRVRRFFEKAPSERRAVMNVISALSELAEVYVFGGLLRDLALSGVASFESDVDIVIRPFNAQAFHNWADENGFKPNKFGGFRLLQDRWLFDIWELDRTWAFRHDPSIPRTKYTLKDTTFFNWDAIAYDMKANQIICSQSYFSDLAQRRLEVNYEPNPNPLGTLVRSLKFIKNGAKPGPKLSQFIRRNMDKNSDFEISQYDKNQSRIPSLDISFIARMRDRCSSSKFAADDFEWISADQMALL